jgi:hypothetical protein
MILKVEGGIVRRRRLKTRPLGKPTAEATRELEAYWAGTITACVAALGAEKKAEEDHYEALAEAADEKRIARHNGRPA